MTQADCLPASAPFDAEQRESLGRLLTKASPVQRAWLAGFLAGRDWGTDGAAADGALPGTPRPDAPSPVPLTVLYASESGNGEALAGQLASRARKLGLRPRLVDLATADLAGLASAANLLVVASTWGEGEPPGRAAAAYATLMGDRAPRLDGVRFGVLALGDTAYAEFCAVGRALDARLAALGATRVVERADCDLDYHEQAEAWIAAALDRLRPATVPARAHPPAEATATQAVGEVVEHINLNSSRSAKETIHLALAFADGTPPYEPGDALDLFPQNDPAMVDRVLASAGLAADEALRRSLLVERDVTTLSAVTVERFAQATGHASVRAMVAEGQARAWADGRQLIDLLQAYPAALTADQLTAVTRKLPPRAYSIASSRKEVGDEAHLLVAAVRYRSQGQAREGVASAHLADRVRTGALLKVRLKPNPRFRLPADPATDIIMVGPGTGVAPFRAFVQERRAIGATGRSWLFFGAQRFTHDFLYQLEWQEALEDGSLTRIDLAFSRDQPEKVYVQDRLRTHGRTFVDWMEGGAQLYVCGDAKAMAKDVRRAVGQAYAEVKALGADAAEDAVRQLEASGRYHQDVY